MSDTAQEPGSIPLAPCPHCANQVPAATFCGACGAHLTQESSRATRRHHAYAAFPEEPVLRLVVTSSLFPHLPHRSKATFRAAVGLVVAVLVALALGGVEAPAVAVSALGLPVIYLLYLYEIHDPGRTRLLPAIVLVVLVGAALGVGWGLVGGHYVNEALGVTLDFSLVQPSALAAALAVPAVAVVLMTVPALVSRVRHANLPESLDGFVLAALGALAFVAAGTLTQQSSLLSAGQFSQASFTGTLTQVVIRGLCSPILAASLIGGFGASLWATVRTDGPAGRRWLSSAAVPLVTVLLLEVGLGFSDIARLSDPALLVCHLVGTAVALMATRFSLHYVLLHEQGSGEIGATGVCPHCHFVVSNMVFCPHCGVARSATAPSRRTAPGRATPVAHRSLRRMGHRHLFGILTLVLAALSGILVLLVVVLQPAAPKSCPQLFECGGPIASQAVRVGHLYKSRQFGFTVEYQPGQISGMSASKDGIVFDFALNAHLEQGQVEIVGIRSDGDSAAEVVSAVQSQIAPNATTEYTVPNPSIGDVPADGEAYDLEQNGASNSEGLERLIVLAAVRGNLAIAVIDLGPYWDFSSTNRAEMKINDHPSPADQFAALLADPLVNSVGWPK